MTPSKPLSPMFDQWQKNHPGQPFSAFYSWNVERQLRAGIPHSTLSTCSKKSAVSHSGLIVFEKLKLYGLTEGAFCVDYGCGTLRVGQHVIRFLPAATYWGLDISKFLQDQGRERLGQPLMDEKRPHLRLISPASIQEIASQGAPFVFSIAVMMHVHPNEMDAYLHNLITLVGEQGQAVITAKFSAETVQYSERSWCHSLDQLRLVLDDLDVDLEILEETEITVPGIEYASRCWFRIRRRPEIVS